MKGPVSESVRTAHSLVCETMSRWQEPSIDPQSLAIQASRPTWNRSAHIALSQTCCYIT